MSTFYQVPAIPSTGGQGNGSDAWIWTETGKIVRWVLFGSIIFFVALYLPLAYAHVCWRLQKGLPPLLYHRWLVPRELRRLQNPSEISLRMDEYPHELGQLRTHQAPPPVYDGNSLRPPSYRSPAPSFKSEPSVIAGGDLGIASGRAGSGRAGPEREGSSERQTSASQCTASPDITDAERETST